jgi:broad specificity phosphatase PhoE
MLEDERQKRVELVIARHGSKDTAVGVPGDPPLTQAGREQTVLLGRAHRERLLGLSSSSSSLVRVYASPLLRTV